MPTKQSGIPIGVLHQRHINVCKDDWVLLQADECCGVCGSAEPFERDDCTGFPEIHHVATLADGGPAPRALLRRAREGRRVWLARSGRFPAKDFPKVGPQIVMGKRLVRHWDVEECTKRFPSFHHIKDE